MSFDEFYDKLVTIEADYKKVYGRELVSIDELKKYLDIRLINRKSKSLKSLKGLGF